MAAGLTQAELAERAGISERTVSDLERGRRGTVYPATARRLAASLDVRSAAIPAFLSEAGRRPEDVANSVDPMDRGGAPGARRARIPSSLTRLLGREPELAACLGMIRDPDVRLVTLVGSGGVGKTRLATEIATLVEADFPGGVYFITLSAIDDPGMLLTTVASAIGLPSADTGSPESLERRFGRDRALVVLDTFEHLLAAGPLLSDLLAMCPTLSALVTSRARLHLRGEREVHVPPLRTHIGLEASGLAPAVELFLERAAAVDPAFDVTPEATQIVTDICSRLNGLPLAIELAAARVRHMPITSLRTQLRHRLDPLVGGARDLPLRQRTMRATMDWSYALLGATEMRLFRALAAFRGGFGTDAVAAMIQQEGMAAARDVMPPLSALVDSSLVLLGRGSSDEGRYLMLDVTRDYAVERSVAAREFDGLRRRHADFFLALAERAEPELRGARQQEWYARLLADEGNFRAAMTWALELGAFDVGLRLAGALWMFWRWAGLFAEGRTWLEAAFAGGAGSSLEARCQCLWGAGWLAYHQGDYRRTGEVGAQMLAELANSDRDVLRRNALTLVGNAALGEGRAQDAIEALTRAVALTRSPEITWHHATSLLNLGTARMHAGQVDAARKLFGHALAIYEELGDRHFLAGTLIQLGYAELLTSGPIGAGPPIARAMEIAAEIGDGWGIAEGLDAVATVRSASEPRSAVRLAAAAAHLRERISMRQHVADAVINQRFLNRAKETMTTDAVAALWREGTALTLAEALAEARAGGPTELSRG
ncbi:MAG: helix-turn-helix domain-containing protein [Chloroflexota bacterium]|nr:helix-turn-helix domain-containing protein [Chloroflexota bacterium]